MDPKLRNMVLSKGEPGKYCFLITILLFWPSIMYAHGVMGETGKGGIVLQARYDTGEPMSYCKVRITAPNSKLAFQVGNTDRNGRFCFFPDTQGEWNVVVSDEMGHRLEMVIPVKEEMKSGAGQRLEGPVERLISRYERAITGLSLIFGVTGIILWWRTKRSKIYLNE